MDRSVYEYHRKLVAEHLPHNSIAILMSGSQYRKSGDVFYEFFAERNFFYLVGLNESNSIIAICKDEYNDVKEYIWVERRDRENERWNGKKISCGELERLTGLPIYDYTDKFDSWLCSSLQRKNYTIYLDLHNIENDKIELSMHNLLQTIKNKFPWVKFGNLYNIISRLREIKSVAEIKAMKKGITITKDAVVKLMQKAKLGMKEYQLKALWDYIVLSHGVRDMAFQPIIASGENNFIMHYSDYSRTIKEGDIILCDVGVNWDGLCCDISRAWPINEWFTIEEEKFYRCILDCSQELFDFVKPGIQMRDVYRMQRRIMRKKIIEYKLAIDEEQANQLIWHGGAHHIGYDNHDEVHISKHESRLIEPNMVFAIDIGLYDVKKNIGFRLEDDCLVTESGNENLTIEIPRQLDELRSILKRRC